MQYKNIEQQALDNSDFRRVVFTNQHSQLVLMSIEPGNDIGKEVHHVDQILFFVAGNGKAEVGAETREVGPGDVVDVPAGSEHNFINTGSEPLKLYTVYAPAEHPDGTVHKTKAEADAAEAEY
jgi:mannose-6-phosphate isomerase-like protein (cupin superfamily)